jgi:hypothetical protein
LETVRGERGGQPLVERVGEGVFSQVDIARVLYLVWTFALSL